MSVLGTWIRGNRLAEAANGVDSTGFRNAPVHLVNLLGIHGHVKVVRK